VFLRRLTSALIACAAFLALAVSGRAQPGKPVDSLAGARVAITIDDIPDHGILLPDMSREQIARGFIRILRDNGIKDAFGFTNGNFMPENAQELAIFKLWLSAGYPLGNHTYDHLNLDEVGPKAYIANIAAQDQLLATLAAYSPLVKKRRMFRYPYCNEGNTLAKRNTIRRYLAENGYRIAEVTTDYFDWAWTDAYTRCLKQHDDKSIAWMKDHVAESADLHLRDSEAESKALFKRRIPQILLLHDGSFDVLTLDIVLKHWRAQGVEFISLEQALADPVYRINPNIADEARLNFLDRIADARGVDVSAFVNTKYSVQDINAVCQERVPKTSEPQLK